VKEVHLQQYVSSKVAWLLGEFNLAYEKVNSLQARKQKVSQNKYHEVVAQESIELQYLVSLFQQLQKLYENIYRVRKTSIYDEEFLALQGDISRIVTVIQHYQNVLDAYLHSGQETPRAEQTALEDMRVTLNNMSRSEEHMHDAMENALSGPLKKQWRRLRKSLTKLSRVPLLPGAFRLKPVHALCVTGLLSCLVACGDDQPNDSPVTRPPVTQQNPLPELDSYSEFREVKNVLILTANQGERIAVIDTLKERRSKRKSTAKFSIDPYRGGAFKIPSFKIKDAAGNISEVTIYIVEQGKRIPEPTGGYQIISLRGHTTDMPVLFNSAKEFEAEHVTYILGGCESTGFVRDYQTERRAIIAQNGIGFSAMNTYTLIRWLDQGQKFSTWDALVGNLRRSSQQMTNEVWFPGDSYP
jgi:hypothetical protein